MKPFAFILACGLLACSPSSDTAEEQTSPATEEVLPEVDVTGEIAEAAASVGVSQELASPSGNWQLFFEIDDRQSFLEKIGQEGANIRLRTKSVDPGRNAIYVADMDINCEESTISNGSFMLEYSNSGEFLSFTTEDTLTWSPIQDDFEESIYGALCLSE